MRKNTILSSLVFVLISFLSISCSKDDIPVLTIQVIASDTNASYNSVKIKGTVNPNGADIIFHGIYWDSSPHPDINSNQSPETSASFVIVIQDLEPDTVYYFRTYAFASNLETYYSEEVSITTAGL